MTAVCDAGVGTTESSITERNFGLEVDAGRKSPAVAGTFSQRSARAADVGPSLAGTFGDSTLESIFDLQLCSLFGASSNEPQPNVKLFGGLRCRQKHSMYIYRPYPEPGLAFTA